MMKSFFLITSFVFIASMMGGCYYDKEDQLYPNSASNNTYCDTSLAKYSKDISTIINGKCATSGCHVPGAQVPDLSTYTALVSGNNISRVQERAITLKTMPSAGPLSSCEMTKLQLWINNGAQND